MAQETADQLSSSSVDKLNKLLQMVEQDADDSFQEIMDSSSEQIENQVGQHFMESRDPLVIQEVAEEYNSDEACSTSMYSLQHEIGKWQLLSSASQRSINDQHKKYMNRSFADQIVKRLEGVSPKNFKKVTLSRMSKFSRSHQNKLQKIAQNINDEYNEKCPFKPTRHSGSDQMLGRHMPIHKRVDELCTNKNALMKELGEKHSITPENYSFSPKMVTPKSKPRSRQNFNNHMSEWISNRENGIKQKRQDRVDAEIASLSQPTILSKSQKMASRKGKFITRYRQKLQEAEENKQTRQIEFTPTFKPTFIARSYSAKSVIAERIFATPRGSLSPKPRGRTPNATPKSSTTKSTTPKANNGKPNLRLRSNSPQSDKLRSSTPQHLSSLAFIKNEFTKNKII